MSESKSNERNIILFDGVCNLCTGFVHLILRFDKKELYTFASLQSESGQQLLQEFSHPLDDNNTFLYIRGSRCLDRSTATLYSIKDLGGIYSAASVFLIVPRPIRDVVYRIVAKYRYRWLGKRDACMIPTPELQRRFLP